MSGVRIHSLDLPPGVDIDAWLNSFEPDTLDRAPYLPSWSDRDGDDGEDVNDD